MDCALIRIAFFRMDYHAQEIFQALLAVYIEHWGTSDAEFIRDLIAELLLALKLCVSAAHWQVRVTQGPWTRHSQVAYLGAIGGVAGQRRTADIAQSCEVNSARARSRN